MLRILWRDLERLAPLDETLAELTRLAEACIVVATRLAERTERRRDGTPRDARGREQRLIVLGMGKLGGRELNVSSDVDLICLWPAAGETDGRRPRDNAEHFVRVVRRLTRLLGAVTADGFAFRVDTRLRPFGESGPLAMHLDAFEHYLLTQGRDWERYAMVKARALTGEAEDIAHLETLRRPFVYRRYLDYDALVSLAELKRMIHRSVVRRSASARVGDRAGDRAGGPGRAPSGTPRPGAKRSGSPFEGDDDIKLGAGGIREAEFAGQAYQLVRGGREPRLQRRPIRAVLRVLGELDLMAPAEVDALDAAYVYLRRVENALQAMRDEQTHRLPVSGDDRARLVAMLGEPDEVTFGQRLGAHREVVRRAFGAVLGGAGSAAAEEADGGDPDGPEAAEPPPPDDPDGARRWLEVRGIEPVPGLLERLAALAGGPFHRRLTARAQQRVERILPPLAAAAVRAAAAGHPPESPLAPSAASAAATFVRALDFVRAVAGRSGYLQAIADRPLALERLVRLFAASGWVAALLTRHPLLLDELLGQSNATLFGDAATIRAEALAEAARLAGADLERQMDAMRQFRNARELRVAAATLDGELTPMQVGDRLSWLAEATLAAVLELLAAPLSIDPRGIGIVAYGKLGGLELGFGSDLDLVFLRGDPVGDPGRGDGGGGEIDVESATRLVRRFVHFMGTATASGRLYEIDLRLRPNGNSGVLVGTLDSFARYQRENAWTWEHQALLRARAVHGEAALVAGFDALRADVLCTARPIETLREDVASMRRRMRETLGSAGGTRMNLKQDAGGVADIEFVVQYLALAHAARHPSLVRFTDNVRVLAEAGRLGLLPVADAGSLSADYLALRARLHRRALALGDAVVPLDPALAALRERVVGHRERILGEIGESGEREPARADPARTDPARAEPGRPDSDPPETDSR